MPYLYRALTVCLLALLLAVYRTAHRGEDAVVVSQLEQPVQDPFGEVPQALLTAAAMGGSEWSRNFGGK